MGRRAPRPAGRARRVRPQVQEVAHGGPADRAGRVQARRARRALEEADERHHQAAQARRRRPRRERLRRGPRGRADLRLDVREGRREEAGRPAVAVLDDHGGDPLGARRPAPRVRLRAAGGGGAVALRGRLDRGHERDARGDDPAALVVRRRGLPGPRADPDAGADRAPRGGDPRVQAGGLLARRRALRAHRRRARPHLRRPLPRRRAAAPEDRGGGGGDRRRRPRPGGHDHEAREVDEEGARAAPLRPDHAPARGEQPLRLLRPAHARRRPAALRGAQGAHLPADELALPDRRHGRRDQADRGARRAQQRSTRAAPPTSPGSTRSRSAA